MTDWIDKWKILLIGSSAILIYQFFKDYKQALKDKKELKKGIKICLTGGPGGGKTEGIAEVSKLFAKRQIPTYIVPEAASILGSGGGLLNFNKYDQEQIINFQYTVMKIQIGLENIMTNISKIKCLHSPVILCDRGLLDGKAYMGQQLWNEMLAQYKLNQKSMLDRYELVFHMVTVADGNPELYLKNTKGVDQSPEQAIKIDNSIKACWKNHPHLYIIDNQFASTFEIKKSFLVTYIYQNILPKLEQGEGRYRKKQSKIVQQAYYSYIERKEKLKKRQIMKFEKKNQF